MNKSIVVVYSQRTLGYEVKYVRLDRRGGLLHRTISCGSAAEAAAQAIDVKRRLFTPHTKIVAPPAVAAYL